MLKKIAKICLIVISLVLLVLLVIGVVWSLDWPWWTGLFILLGLVGVAVGILFLKKIWLRRREQRFVNQVVEQDEARLRGLSDKERERSKELQDRWKEAIETLRRSHLKKQGNPLYVLPWYLVMGESGSGKTTAIKEARLSSPFAEATQASGISGTKNCDWWFFEKAVIIDTAGRYAIPVDEGQDKEEWQRFLNLLRRYRKREPLNGLIITVPADKLLEGGPDSLKQDRLSIRRRIDELMLALGAKFPVYLMVTKCDLIQGMTQFCDRVPEGGLSQAMGFINHHFTRDALAFEGRALEALGERLRDIRLFLVEDSGGEILDPGLLLFPEEFEKLKAGLDAFVAGAFQENPYQETPILRGLYFSSGRQEGAPYSHFLKTLGLIEEKEVLPGTNKGLFLHDFFARILPRDRGIFTPTQKALQWGRLTRNLGLTSWVALILAVCGLMSFSFVKNLKTLRQVSHEFRSSPALRGEVLRDVVSLDRFRKAVLEVEKANRQWWMPRFGLNESQEVEIGLKAKYVQAFKDFLAPLDEKLAARIANFSDMTPDEPLSRHIAHLVRRINLLNLRLETGDLERLKSMPAVPFEPLILQSDQAMIPELNEMVSLSYFHYLIWSRDSGRIRTEMVDLQGWLRHALLQKRDELNWLVAWANSREFLSAVTLEDFWGGSVSVSEAETVEPAFTRAGKEEIEGLLKELEGALPDPGSTLIARQKLDFGKWYRTAYLEKWEAFASGFSKGAERLVGVEGRRQMIHKMATDQGPYFALLDRMAQELEPLGESEGDPGWFGLVFEYQEVKAEAAALAAFDNTSVLGKATQKGEQLIGKLGRKFGKLPQEDMVERRLRAGKAYSGYRKLLEEMTAAAGSRKAAFEAVSQVFGGDSAGETSPFMGAEQAVFQIKAQMDSGKADEAVFWGLIKGPFEYFWTFVLGECACQLQALWEKQVLVEIEGLPDRASVQKILLGENGYALKFLKGPAEPFLSRSLQKGYYAKQVLGAQIPFEPSFLSFMQKGVAAGRLARADVSYPVSVKGLPTDANPEARIKPHATHLELQCADGTFLLENFQYPQKKTFKWSAATCGDVILRIDVGDIVLTKKYTGGQAFPAFLADFRTGQRVFYPKEFPNEENALQGLGIRYIKVRYDFGGHTPVLGLRSAGPGSVPMKIVKCWEE
ncbi:MAG: type VI secretion protein IcmF/TssM N-terminal domain-containing protein [Desulfatiglandales bacterium]